MKKFALLALLGSAAFGGVIISNTPKTLNGNSTITGTSAFAVGFTMNAGTNYTVDDVIVDLTNQGTAAIPGSHLNIGLFANNSGAPTGSALVTFTLSGNINAGNADYTATPNSSFQLQASTTYWLVLNDPTSADALVWVGALNSNPSGPAAADAGDANGSMTSATQVNTFFHNENATIFQYQIDGTAVTAGATPEPGTMLLAGAALVGLVAIRRARA
jgi:hypothetical protein